MNDSALEHYRSTYARIGDRLIAPWFAEQREAALQSVLQNGFPTLRHENWKYTDIRPITRGRFRFTEPGEGGLPDSLIDSLRLQGADSRELIFINGYSSESSSRPGDLPGGAVIAPLVAAVNSHPDILKRHMGTANGGSAFASLNTALLQDGAFIYIPDDTEVAKPICLYYLVTDTGQAFTAQPHNLIILGRNARAVVAEFYASHGEPECFTNVTTKVIAGDGARLEHYKIQQESDRTYHIGYFTARLDRDAVLESHVFTLGGRLVRNDLVVDLSDPGSEVMLNGLYAAGGKQHVDNHTLVNHLRPHTRSEEYYRGILGDQSRGVFNGKVVVHKGAEKADAHQSNDNLLLSNDAEIDTKPELEIYEDDVKCSHGATVGQLDEDMLFYLRTRAIEEGAAGTLLTYAFARHVIDRIKFRPLRQRLEHLVVGRLPGAGIIREFTR